MPSTSATQGPAVTFDANHLQVEHGHRVYYEQSGAREGIPVVVLHGGPGSGSTPRHREFFDRERYRIVQIDQRGSGRSEPHGATAHNHSQALIGDIERLRELLQIPQWLVFGGSWGSSLALAYAAAHRERVSGLVLRGVFLTGQTDMDWFFHGAAALLPEAHARFIEHIPRRWRRNMPAYLDRSFRSADATKTSILAREWLIYESALNDAATIADAVPWTVSLSDRMQAKYTIQSHYLARRCFFGEKHLLQAASGLRGLPVAIVHGSMDLVCRPLNAWRVHRACAGSRLAWARGAGHDPFHPVSMALLRDANRCFAEDGHFAQWPSPIAS